MCDHPLIQGVYSSITFVCFHSKMQKNSTCVCSGKKLAQQAWKITQTAYERFPNYIEIPTTHHNHSDAEIFNPEVQGCISCGILVSGIQARGVSSEHMENMEMFSCSPT